MNHKNQRYYFALEPQRIERGLNHFVAWPIAKIGPDTVWIEVPEHIDTNNPAVLRWLIAQQSRHPGSHVFLRYDLGRLDRRPAFPACGPAFTALGFDHVASAVYFKLRWW